MSKRRAQGGGHAYVDRDVVLMLSFHFTLDNERNNKNKTRLYLCVVTVRVKGKKDVNKKELIDSQTINREIFHVIATYHVLAQVSKFSNFLCNS